MHRTIPEVRRERRAILAEAHELVTNAKRAGKTGLDLDDHLRFGKLLDRAELLAGEIDRLSEQSRSILASTYEDGDPAMTAPQTFTAMLTRNASMVAEHRALSLGVASAGGNTAPTGFVNELYRHLELASPVVNVARTFTTDDEADLIVPTLATWGSAASVAEGSALPGADPSFAQVTFKAHRYAQLVKVSRTLLASQAVNLDSFMAELFARNIDAVTGPLYAFGTGTTEPEGYAYGAGTAVTGGTAVGGSFSYDNLVDMISGLDSAYQANAVWLMSPSAVGSLRKITDDQERPLWQPSMALGEPATLLGRPVYVDRHLGAVETSGTSVVVMDPGAYGLRFGGGGIRIDRSDDAFFSTDEVGFRAVTSTDARYLDSAGAIRFVGGSA